MQILELTYPSYETATLALKQADPVLAAVMDRVGICKLDEEQQTGDLLDSLSEGIIYQQISVKAAAAIHRKFLMLFANRNCFTAKDVLEIPDETLKSAGLSNSKVICLKDLAWKILQGMPTLTDLLEMQDEEIIQTLIQVKGIGRWTVKRFLIFRLPTPHSTQ
jgi:DNA-3-methyladenine glycosylase II